MKQGGLTTRLAPAHLNFRMLCTGPKISSFAMSMSSWTISWQWVVCYWIYKVAKAETCERWYLDVRENCGLNEVSLGPEPFASTFERGAAFDARFYVSQHLVELFLVDLRKISCCHPPINCTEKKIRHLGTTMNHLRALLNAFLEGIAHGAPDRTGLCLLEELVVHAFVDECTRPSTTTLTLNAEIIEISTQIIAFTLLSFGRRFRMATWLKNRAKCASSTALSMSASSHTMKGDLPPSSRVTFLRLLRAASSRTIFPVSVDPVKASWISPRSRSLSKVKKKSTLERLIWSNNRKFEILWV